MPQYSGMWTLSQASQAVKNQTWTGLPPSVVEYLVVAGGGAGGAYQGGGGGAGGLLAGYTGITAGTSYFVTVGGGAAQAVGAASPGTQGTNSVLIAASSGATTGNIVATGGGGGSGGGGGGGVGTSGGSGGGGGSTTAVLNGLAGISGQGNAGGKSGGQATNYASGGGGGAGTVGISVNTDAHPGGNGGSGIASSISGRVAVYAGGGGGGATASNTFGFGGAGGGGNGGSYNATTNGDNATVNTGGGGGGGGNGSGTKGGAGGSGIVIIRYPGTIQYFTGGTLSYADGYISHTFYANGVLAPTTPTLYANPDYQIARSLRFNSADSTYLNRTPATTTNQKTWTWSAWVKNSTLSTYGHIFTASTGTGTTEIVIRFENDGCLGIGFGASYLFYTTQVFRDASAWYHLVLAIDTTQATASDRGKFYVNGVQVTSFSTTNYPTQNSDWAVNQSGNVHSLGRLQGSSTGLYFASGYLAEINFIDGQQLTPSSFGWTNPATGVWEPLDYVGSYGTNGFHLNFSDNSNITAATLGADTSGNGNNWTPNNFSVTAGVGNDSLVDTPTSYGTDTGVGGEVRGNYCTLNPLDRLSTVTAPLNGNLQYNTANSTGLMRGTIGVKSAKWYYEATITTVPTSGSVYIGVKDSADSTMTSSNGLGSNGGTTNEFGYSQTGATQNNGTAVAGGNTLTAGDVLMVAYDLDSGKIWWGKNGTWFASGDPATGANPMFSTLTSLNGYSPAIGYNFTDTNGVVNFNFGQRPFAYTAPSGYKALNTQNLPTPTIGATSATLANKYFNAITYTGNGSQSVTGVGFQPDWVWVKSRSSGAYNHQLHDAVRGATAGALFSNDTLIEQTSYQFDSFDSNGFTTDASNITGINDIDNTFVAWNWNAGGSTVSNTTGSISSQVRASPTSGFSIVTYTGTGANATVGHGLGVAPSMYIVKARNDSSGYNWSSYHVALGNTQYIALNTTGAAASASSMWNSTTPTSAVFSLGTNATVNASSKLYVAYCFAEVPGYSKIGSYIGNGSADGPFVYTGFRPAFIFYKRSSTAGNSWRITDSTRSTYNPDGNAFLYPDTTTAEGVNANDNLDILSNGFKIRTTNDPSNASGSTIIYMAFAENPFKYSLAR